MASASRSQLLYPLLLLLLPLSAVSQTYRNITLGSILSALDDRNATWASPSGDFTFGFNRLAGDDLYLLAIWFAKIPEKTIVWSANRDNLVQRGSTVELTRDGRFVLNDHQGQQVWEAPPINGKFISAAMLDTGNLVITSTDPASTWESFNHPTDTMLPTQILVPDTTLFSPTETDHSSGRFQFRFQSNGNLILYSTALSKNFTQNQYWASGTNESASRFVFDQYGDIYLAENSGILIRNLTSGNVNSTEEFYHRATLDYDGAFRQYIYPKTRLVGGSWSAVWSVPLPSEICMGSGQGGSGICGFNSYCKLQLNQRASCECPTGYSYLDPKNTFEGCKQNFTSQSCERFGLSEISYFTLIEMSNSDWPGQEYEKYSPTTEDQCKNACLRDCLCAVARYSNGICSKKKHPLAFGRFDNRVEGKIFIKVRANPSSRPFPPMDSGTTKKDQSTLILIGSILLGSSVFINFLLLLAIALGSFYLYYLKKLLKLRPDSSISGINLHSFTYKELEEATDEFKEELGHGAFGTVYKGVLALDSRNMVAVKRLNKVVEDGEKEFKAEVSAIGRTHHRNLVQLLGFCDEESHRLLVYEFMSNGSLASFLFGVSRPHWNQRVHIAFGIARGLAYLHELCRTQIIHCDIKPQNILLDENFIPRISDFGLAKLLKAEQTKTSTAIRGTRGYVAPEWFKNMPITVKVDVYSFGIVLLEIICCRKNVLIEVVNEEKPILDNWVYGCYKQGRLNVLVGNDDEAINDMRRLERLVMVAIWCIQEEPSLRPSMKKVTQMLEGAVQVPVPPDPSSFISSLD